jgi:hypothetical protein
MAHTKIHYYAVNAFKPKNLLKFSVHFNSFQTVYYVAIPKTSGPDDIWFWNIRPLIFNARVSPTKQFESDLDYTAETVRVGAQVVTFDKKNVKRAKPNSKEFVKYDASYTFVRFDFYHSFQAVRNLQVMFYKDLQIIQDMMQVDNKSRARRFHTELPTYDL